MHTITIGTSVNPHQIIGTLIKSTLIIVRNILCWVFQVLGYWYSIFEKDFSSFLFLQLHLLTHVFSYCSFLSEQYNKHKLLLLSSTIPSLKSTKSSKHLLSTNKNLHWNNFNKSYVEIINIIIYINLKSTFMSRSSILMLVWL